MLVKCPLPSQFSGVSPVRAKQQGSEWSRPPADSNGRLGQERRGSQARGPSPLWLAESARPGRPRWREARRGQVWGRLPHESPGSSVPAPALFYAYCHPVGAELWMADAKALTAPGTKPRCKMQPRGSARPRGQSWTGPEAGSGDETSLAPDPGLQQEGLEGPMWTTAEPGCLPGVSRSPLPTTRGMTL